MTQIVCVSHSRWDIGPNRVKNLIKWLPDADVLYFEPAQPFFSKLNRPREGKKVEKNVTAFTLPQNISTDEEAPTRIARRSKRNAAYIRKCMEEHSFEHPLLWLRCPDEVELAFELSECDGLLYDCDKDWSHLASHDWEAVLCSEADVVLAASSTLRARLLEYNDNIALIPNGLDYDLFSRSAKTYPSFPADLQGIPHPVFGYLGEVGDFVQLGPVFHAASTHPEWNFVFVGSYSRLNPRFPALKKLDNVHFLGKKSLPSLPRYLAGFDICISLLNDRDPEPALVSEQLYQYLSSGKPIVSMAAGNTQPFYSDVVYAAHFDIEFVNSCQFALEENSRTAAERRLQYAVEADWAVRGEKLVRIFEANGFL